MYAVDNNLPASSQLPDGMYFLLMDPSCDVFPDVTSPATRFCTNPFKTCPHPFQYGPQEPNVTLDPALLFCWNLQLEMKACLKEKGLTTQPDHNMVHWGGPRGNKYHAYMLGPIFAESDLDIVSVEARRLSTRARSHFHVQTGGRGH